MTTNNAINLSDNGLAKYDGSGTFDVATGVPDGLTGSQSFNAYGVLCGGTTSTNPVQSIDPGDTGDLLYSNGAGFLPEFRPPRALVLHVSTNGFVSQPIGDNTTYYFMNDCDLAIFSTGILQSRIYMPIDGVITTAYGFFDVSGTLASNENNTVNIVVNGSSTTAISSTIQLTANDVTFNNTGLSVNISVGDYIQITWVTPTFATNPTVVSASLSLVIET